MKPILFNTDMVKAILDGRKSVTRRVAFPRSDLRPFLRKEYPDGWWFRGRAYRNWNNAMREPQGVMSLCHYRTDDTLYVRETWAKQCGLYWHKAGLAVDENGCDMYGTLVPTKWRPSIHMPKDAARLFLRVTGVRVERLQDINDESVVSEGMKIGDPFDELWDSTIKKADLPRYGWDANPWVWVIEFERISKDEALDNA